MTSPRSRHAGVGTYHRQVPGADDPVELLRPRFRAARTIVARHEVAAGERLDHIADRYYREPYTFWRIADANPDITLARLDEPGRWLEIPERP